MEIVGRWERGIGGGLGEAASADRHHVNRYRLRWRERKFAAMGSRYLTRSRVENDRPID